MMLNGTLLPRRCAGRRLCDPASVRARVRAFAHRCTLGNSCMVRSQAPRHSIFVMCVAGSQKAMQSARDLPPPPGVLGADSLGLGEPGDKARLLDGGLPPVENCVSSCGESGAMGGACGAGAASVVGASVAGGGVAGAAGGLLERTAVVPEVEDGEEGRVVVAEGVVDAAGAFNCTWVVPAGLGMRAPATGAARKRPVPVGERIIPGWTAPPGTWLAPPADRASAPSLDETRSATATTANGAAERILGIGHLRFPKRPLLATPGASLGSQRPTEMMQNCPDDAPAILICKGRSHQPRPAPNDVCVRSCAAAHSARPGHGQAVPHSSYLLRGPQLCRAHEGDGRRHEGSAVLLPEEPGQRHHRRHVPLSL